MLFADGWSFTLGKNIGWWLVASLLGVAIGLAIGALLWKRRTRVVTKTRGGAYGESPEVERLRQRVTNLEAAAAERDRLRGQVKDLETQVKALQAGGKAGSG
jgi:hypothetical protein